MDSIDSFFLFAQLERGMFLGITSGNISVRCFLLERFAVRHGQEALLDLQDLYYPQNYVLDHDLCPHHRLHFLCHRNELAQQLNFWTICSQPSQLLPRYTHSKSGQLLAYTPILMFQDLNRYVYAMYYSFALVSTIAFGDIIGKNYIQDIYVAILIVLSTIVIALVVEQMYMIFRRKKTRFFELLNKIRFLSQRLKGYKQIPSNFRMEIINFLTELSWKHLNQQPAELENAVQFKTKLMRQSVIFNPQLPLFYAKYVLHKLKLAHLPKGILVYNNLPQKQQLISYLVTKGKFWVGYSTLKGRLAGGYTLQKQGMNFGIQQAFAGTNDLYRYLQVRTVTSGSVLTINAKQLRETMLQLQDIDFPYEKPIEHFQNAKDYAMFNKNKYECFICSTTEHTLIDCPTCHYVVTHATKVEITKKFHDRGLRHRKNQKSKKIRNIHLQTISEKPGKSWRLMEIERYRQIFNKIKYIEDQNDMLLQKWHEWTVYGSSQTENFDKQNQQLGRNTNFSYTFRHSKVI